MVALLLDRSPEYMIAMLAVLKVRCLGAVNQLAFSAHLNSMPWMLVCCMAAANMALRCCTLTHYEAASPRPFLLLCSLAAASSRWTPTTLRTGWGTAWRTLGPCCCSPRAGMMSWLAASAAAALPTQR